MPDYLFVDDGVVIAKEIPIQITESLDHGCGALEVGEEEGHRAFSEVCRRRQVEPLTPIRGADQASVTEVVYRGISH
jgi:hypothetical protein